MEIGIFAKTFPAATLAGCLDQVVAHDIRAVQFNMACAGLPALPLDIPKELAVAIGAAFRERHLDMAGVSATFNMIHPDPELRNEGFVAFREIARAAGRMGARLLTLCTGTRDPVDPWRRHPDNDSPAAWRDLMHSMNKAIEIAETFDLLLGVEPEAANVVRDAPSAWRLLYDLRSPRVRIILDPANLFTRAEPSDIRDCIAEAIDLLADSVIMAHAKDRTRSGDIRPAGKGDIDFAFFIRKLRETGFNGPLVLHGLAAKDVDESVGFLQALLEKVV